MNIGRLIFSRRKELNLTLEEIGSAVGVSKSTVKKWESGYIANIKRDKIAALAKVLQISPVLLIEDNLYSSESKGFTVFAMDGIEGQHSVTVNEEKSEKLAELLKIARDLPDEKIDMLLKMADSIK